MCPDADRRAGFTLLEALIAMVALTLLAAVLLRGIVSIRDDAAWFEGHTGSALVASSVLNEALADRHLVDGTRRGTRDGLRYSLTASNANIDAQLAPARPEGSPQAPAPRPKPGSAAAGTALWRPQRLVVTVEAPMHPLTIETTRLAAAP